MKNLKFKKVKIAKINNLSMILGGNNVLVSYQKTIVDNCIPDSLTCTVESIQGYTCPTTTNGGTLRTQGGFAETNECGG